MVKSSITDREFLDYRPSAHPGHGRPGAREWLLWPALAYRVVAPAPRRRKLDVFQRAILGLLSASRLTPTEMAEQLGVKPELSEFVVTELQSSGYVLADLEVTKRGRDTLEEEREAEVDLVTGWVFKDPWSGSLWPFVASSLERAAIVHREDKLFLEQGTTGEPKQYRVWAQVAPKESDTTPPDARAILRAVTRSHWLGSATASSRHGSEEVEAWDDVVSDVTLRRISVIEEQPVPVSLVTFVYVLGASVHHDIGWYACDLFGRGSSPELKHVIEQVAVEDGSLQRRLDRMLEQSFGKRFEEYRETIELRRQQAQRLLERTLTMDISTHQVASPLAEMLFAWLCVESLGESARVEAMGALGRARVSLEQLFGDLKARYPLAGVEQQLAKTWSKDDNNHALNRKKIQAAAKRIGFDEVPASLTKVYRNKLSSVANHDNAWQLRPLLLATLLRASNDPDHPMWSAAKELPELLILVDEIASAAGSALHGGKHDPIGTKEVTKHIENTLRITGALLGLPMTPLREDG